jgi:hypothetical protein
MTRGDVMSALRAVSLLLPLALQSCFSVPSVAVHAGFASLALDGDIGFTPATTDSENAQRSFGDGGSGTAIRQDIDDALGLGDHGGSPYLRAEVDLGVPVLSLSGLVFEDSGNGVLQQQFGSNLPATTPVSSDFELTNLKAALAFDLGFGPVKISPGLALSYIDLNVGAEDVLGVFREELDLQAPIPLAFLRGSIDLAYVALVAEVGYMEIDVEDLRAEMLDVEALLEFRPTKMFNLFLGYRSLQVRADGRINDDRVDIDVGLSGFILGGGFRF